MRLKRLNLDVTKTVRIFKLLALNLFLIEHSDEPTNLSLKK